MRASNFLINLLVFAIIISSPSLSHAKRAALVIGNGDYEHAGVLRNPVNDALAISQKLREFGFDVLVGTDLNHAQFREVVREFSSRARTAEEVLLFFAGHGIQADSENYLIPIDANIRIAADLRWNTVSVRDIMREIEGPGRTTIIMLDACRNNPLARRLRSLTSSTRSMQVGRGLARMVARRGSYIAFATAPGDVADDGDGANSPFTSAVLKRIDEPGLDIARLMRRVRRDVQEATAGQQTPWSNSSLLRDFAFVEAEATGHLPVTRTSDSSVSNSQLQKQAELAFWATVKDSTDPAIIATYVDRFPNGTFTALARLLIEKLEAQRESAMTEQTSALEVVEEAASPTNEEAQKPVVRDAKELKIVARPQDAAHVDPTTSKPKPLSGRDIATELQSELKRVGCYKGRIDGDWGPKSRAALKNFLLRIGKDLADDTPSAAFVDLVSQRVKVVCLDVRKRRAVRPRRDPAHFSHEVDLTQPGASKRFFELLSEESSH